MKVDSLVKLAVRPRLWSIQALSPEQGQTFLDVGSGTGYLTMVAANLVGHSGKAVGLEVCLHPSMRIACCCSAHKS